MQSEKKQDIENTQLCKKLLRKEVLSVREQMTEHEWQEKSRKIEAAFLALPEYQEAEHILCYVSYKREVDTCSLIKKSLLLGKHVYCPAVCGKKMDFYEIFSLDELVCGYRGILEPKNRFRERLFSMPESGKIFILLPGTVFDISCHRIGYGGGYYDKYLEKLKKNACKIFMAAAAFSFQVKVQIPYEEHDICPQKIITEQESFQIDQRSNVRKSGGSI